MVYYVATPSLSFEDAVSSFFRKMFKISGRSRRSEYWWIALLLLIASFSTYTLYSMPYIDLYLGAGAGVATSLFGLLTIPLAIRRLHDIGCSGWWFILPVIVLFIGSIIFLVSLVGAGGDYDSDEGFIRLLMMNIPLLIVMLLFLLVYPTIMIIFHCLDSQIGDNEYGPSPKYMIIDGSGNLTFMGMNGAQIYTDTTKNRPEM